MESMGPLMATAFGEPRPSRRLKMLTPRADVANRAIRTQNSAPWIRQSPSAPTMLAEQGLQGEQSPRKVHGSSCAFRASFRIEPPIRFFWVTGKA
jgi:hypothetical protein